MHTVKHTCAYFILNPPHPTSDLPSLCPPPPHPHTYNRGMGYGELKDLLNNLYMRAKGVGKGSI